MDVKQIGQEFFDTWKEVMIHPEAFFAKWDQGEGWEKSMKFVLICGLVAGALTTVLTLFHGISTLILYPLSMAVGTVIGGVILFVCFKLLGGTGAVEPTIKMVAYTGAVGVISMGIPFIGWLAGFYQIWLLIVGGKAVHRLDTGKAAIAVLIPVAVVTLLFALLALLGVGMVAMFARAS